MTEWINLSETPDEWQSLEDAGSEWMPVFDSTGVQLAHFEAQPVAYNFQAKPVGG